MDVDKRVADYFVVAGLPDSPSPLDDVYSRDASSTSTRAHVGLAPITDIAVIFKSMGETVPNGYTCIDTTPFGFPADLNHGSLRSPNVYLCFKRGYDKPPIVDIGVLYEGKDRLLPDSEIVHTTPFGRPANVNNSGARTYITFRRYHETGPCNMLVVTDICIILANKCETPPHAFCVIGKNLNKGMVGSDVFVCYKKSMHRPELLCFKPEILGRFPQEDYENFPLPSSVPLFCLPMGATLEAWPKKAKQQKPLFSTFVLTVSDAVEKVFGAAVTFYENYPIEKLSEEQKRELGVINSANHSVYGNKSICILSHWPFFDTFEKFLHYLHTMSISGRHHLPLERYISHFMLNVPFPSPQRPRILIQLASDRISLIQPEDSPLPLSGASFKQLLRNLGPENCMMVLLFALLEQKLLIHSLRPDVLTSVAEAVAMIIFPFHWQCPYIPLCPLGLADVLNAPLPFIVGVDSRYFDIYEPPYDVTCVDLDTNTISICEEKRPINLKLFPKKAARTLRNTLQVIFDKVIKMPANSVDKENIPPEEIPIDQDFKLKKKERVIELEIQEAFLRFMSSILKGYKSYLLPITKRPTVRTTDASSLFDLQGFLKSRDRTYHRFYSLMMRTQMFTRFIEERSFVSNNDASLAFFDDCSEKIESSTEGFEFRLLESDDSQKSDRTVFLTPPEPMGLPPGVEYKYKEFGTLRNDLFIHPTYSNSTFEKVKNAESSFTPGSPLAKRTKQEMKSALKAARRQAETPMLWAKCLLSYCYSLWFIHLPSYVKSSSSKSKALNIAYEVLMKMQSLRLYPADEVCYRVLMQLCGQYSQPVLAVKVLFEMKRIGMQPNAITYGFYNKAVLESEWPSASTSASLLWNKLRNVILGIAQFKRAMKLTRAKRSLSLNSDLDLVEHPSRASSRCSNLIDNQTSLISGQNPEFVNDLIKVDEPVVKDDRSSTGAQSDMGYCSMNHDDTKKSTSSIASQSSQTASSNQCININAAPKEKQKPCNFISSNAAIMRYADFRASDEFRSKVGSIVKKSGGRFALQNKLDEKSIDSIAGILITSRANFHEDSVFCDMQSNFFSDSDKKRKRHKSESESNVKSYKEKVDFRTRHCSGSNLKRDSPTMFLETSGENECSKEFNLCSEDFGCDADIISRIGGKSNTSTVSSTGNKQEKVFDKNRVDSLNPKVSNDCNNTPQVINRPRSPNIPIKRKTNVNTEDPLGLFNETESDNLSELNGEFSCPTKDSWFNLDILGNIPRMTSSLSSSLGLNNNGSTNALSSWSMSLASKSAKFSRSATFCEDPTAKDSSKKFLRSTTLPTAESPCQDALVSLENELDETDNSLSNSWLTPIKNNFRRTESFRIKQGLNNLKSKASVAANSVANKITEIKQSISASNTPNKDGIKPYEADRLSVRSRNILDEDAISRSSADRIRLSVDYSYLSSRNPSMCSVNSEEVCGSIEESSLMNKLFSVPGSNDSSRPGSLHHAESAPLFSSFYQKVTPDPQTDSTSLGQASNVALEIIMTTCSKCHMCNNLLYDEEIITGWSADDSNLNTQCQFCRMKVVPLLTISINDYRVTTKMNENELELEHKETEHTPHKPKKSRKVDDISPTDQFILFEDSPESIFTCSSSSSSVVSSPEKLLTHPLSQVNWPNRSDEHVTSNSISIVQSNHKVINECNVDEGSSLLDATKDRSRKVSTCSTTPSFISHDPATVPFLSPLVLRKEIENVLDQEGDLCLTKPQFVDEHPIIYWNLIWFFWRIGVPSHLPGLCLNSKNLNKNQIIPSVWSNADSRNVSVHCRWDNPILHEEMGPLMYNLWIDSTEESSLVQSLITEKKTICRSMMYQILTSIQCNDLSFPMKMLINERSKKANSFRGGRSHGMYRDLLFFAYVTLGRENIDTTAFDKEYRRAFESLNRKQIGTLRKNDKPPSLGSIFCRRYFRELELKLE